VELRGSLPRVAYVRPPVVTVQQPHITFASSSGQIQQNVSPRAIRNPEADQPTHTIGSMSGSVRKRNDVVVLHDGMPGPFFATQFAAKFIKAWRDANR